MKIYRLSALFALLTASLMLAGCAQLPFLSKKPEPTVVVREIPEPAPPVPEAEPALPEPSPAPPTIFTPPVDRFAVGCVLPLSGRHAEAGQRALEAFLLSAGTFNPRFSSPWKLIVEDFQDSTLSVRAAIERLAQAGNVMAIIAVVGTAEALDAAQEAEIRQVPLILITSREGVTQDKEYVFQHFLTPSQQVRSVARYALDSLNVAVFSILYPDDDYGAEMTALFRSEVQKIGGKVDKAIPYGKSQTDFTQQINEITDGRIQKQKEMYARTPEIKPNLSLPFEALFIPDSHFRVRMIAAQLAFYDVTNIALVGTSLWHSPDLLKKDAEYVEGAVFADSFSVTSYLPETNDFIDIYYAQYRREPGNLEALAYDTMEMTLHILEDQAVQTRADFVKALLSVDRHRGATGMTSFNGEHVAQKTPFILRIRNGKIVQVK